MTIAIAFALLFLLVFIVWLFSTPRRGGHPPPKNTHSRPTETPRPAKQQTVCWHCGLWLWPSERVCRRCGERQ